MAVIRDNEIELNSIKYPITDKVRPILSAKFAEKMVVGDYTKASNPEVDSWVIQDQRGGILMEEMDETRDADRSHWSTCNLGFKGHIVLPRLATAVTIPAPQWTSPTGCTLTVDWDDEENTYDESTASIAITPGGAPIADGAYSNWLELTIASTNIDGVRIYSERAGATRDFVIEIFYGDAYHEIYDGTLTESAWNVIHTTTTRAVTKIRIKIENNTGGAEQEKINEVDFLNRAGGAAITPVAFANFNSQLYLAAGAWLLKLNAAGDGFLVRIPVGGFGGTITDIIPSVGNNLYIFMGDAVDYWYMSTAEVFTQTDETAATYGVAWDSKLFKIDSAGSMSYAAIPNHANPDWTDDGDLADEGLADNDVQSLFLYRDASGNPIIYAGTKLGLYAHSFGNDKWIATELAMPQHDTAGKGTVHWRDKSYTSAGLDVLAYQTGQAGTSIVSVGLDRDDGLPQLRGGEIVKFIKGYNEFFALVDSTYEGETSRSTVMAYDGKGWQCWWKAGSNNLHMYTGIVSTKVAHRLWFGCGTSLYYIPLQKNLRNPKKVSTFAYDTAGVHITPWFDANWVGTKLALQLKVFCKDVTANETVLVDYRIDHIEVDLTTGWDNLGTIVAAGNEVETTYTFGTNLGTNFKAIQFRFTLGRDAEGANPEYDSPDIQYAVLEYQKIIKPTWGWAFTIDCTKPYDGRTANQMLDAVVTAAELEVLTPFLYKDTTYYVRVKSVEGERLSGDGRKGTYNVTVLKPI